MTTVHVVVPDGIDDPARPSGGNAYDRRLCDGLSAAGHRVVEHAVPGSWPMPDAAALGALARTVAAVPDGAALLVDGLIASAAGDVLLATATRLRLVVLVHMPLGSLSGATGDERERAVLASCAAVLTTSEWTRSWLCATYGLPPESVHAAVPGTDPAPAATGTRAGGGLLCVAAVAPHKGQDVLVDALARLADLAWTCSCVGSLTVDPEFVADVRRRAAVAGIDDRVRLLGVRVGPDLEDAYAAADLLVLPSRGETYGMVVAEALARAVPVLASDVGGVAEALGHRPRAGVLVPPDDVDALTDVLRRWLTEPALRQSLRQRARDRGAALPSWSTTIRRVDAVLSAVAA